MLQQEGEQRDPSLPCTASPVAPRKAAVSQNAFDQNLEDHPREAEQEDLCGQRTPESVAGVPERQEGSGRDMAWPPGNSHSNSCSHVNGDCRVPSAWECHITSPGQGGAVRVWHMPPDSQGKKLATVRDMKELSKAHETSSIDCET